MEDSKNLLGWGNSFFSEQKSSSGRQNRTCKQVSNFPEDILVFFSPISPFYLSLFFSRISSLLSLSCSSLSIAEHNSFRSLWIHSFHILRTSETTHSLCNGLVLEHLCNFLIIWYILFSHFLLCFFLTSRPFLFMNFVLHFYHRMFYSVPFYFSRIPVHSHFFSVESFSSLSLSHFISLSFQSNQYLIKEFSHSEIYPLLCLLHTITVRSLETGIHSIWTHTLTFSLSLILSFSFSSFLLYLPLFFTKKINQIQWTETTRWSRSSKDLLPVLWTRIGEDEMYTGTIGLLLWRIHSIEGRYWQ